MVTSEYPHQLLLSKSQVMLKAENTIYQKLIFIQKIQITCYVYRDHNELGYVEGKVLFRMGLILNLVGH